VTDATIKRFIDQGKPADFDQLAIDLVARQLEERVVGCESSWSSLSPDHLESWQAIPPIPTSTHGPTVYPTGDDESIALVMQACWRTLAPPAESPILLLAPTDATTTAGALALATYQATAGLGLTHPFAERRIDTSAVRSWLAARQRSGHPATIVATVELVGRLLRFLERRRLRFRLPAGSQLITIESSTETVEAPPTPSPSMVERLGLEPADTRRLIIVSTLTTPLLTRRGSDSTPILVAPGHWVRYRLIRGTSGPEDEVDRLAIMDLATTRLPCCQEIELRAVTGDEGGLVLQD